MTYFAEGTFTTVLPICPVCSRMPSIWLRVELGGRPDDKLGNASCAWHPGCMADGVGKGRRSAFVLRLKEMVQMNGFSRSYRSVSLQTVTDVCLRRCTAVQEQQR